MCVCAIPWLLRRRNREGEDHSGLYDCFVLRRFIEGKDIKVSSVKYYSFISVRSRPKVRESREGQDDIALIYIYLSLERILKKQVWDNLISGYKNRILKQFDVPLNIVNIRLIIIQRYVYIPYQNIKDITEWKSFYDIAMGDRGRKNELLLTKDGEKAKIIY